MKVIFFIGGILSFFVLITPPSVYTHTEIVYQSFILLSSVYTLFCIIKAIKRKRNGAIILIIGFTFLFISTVNDILYAQYANRITPFQSLIPFGLFIFILLQSYILSKHFSQVFIDASIDELTQIYNRRHFIKLSRQEIKRALRTKRPISILAFDIDHFKHVNDKYGHSAGDIVLKSFAKTIKNNIRDIDIFGRIGGEEFSLLLPETKLKEAVLLADRLRKIIGKLDIKISKKMINITISVGVTESKDNSEITLETLMKNADKLLYKAKNNGRNRVEYLQKNNTL